ncbi:MAG: rhomboid family intramembrane serine protease [Sedimentisphaerales bacterium]|nr:rhomboid family intramembrane serine protease [Sedimentisphaerales bacterium]
MGLYDRDYTQQDRERPSPFSPQMRLGFPSITPAVKGLLIANVAVYLIGFIASGPTQSGQTLLIRLFALYPATTALTLQLWRLITYQFLHGGIFHIFFNMLGLFFLGPALERRWGSRKFLTFYLSCGVAGGIFYIILVSIGYLAPLPMIGASGAVLGVFTACAILFPQIVVFLFFFPVPIRVAAILFILYSVVTIFSRGANVGGEACHLAGVAAGAFYVFSQSWRTSLKLRFKAGRWGRSIESERKLRIEVDRILKKVHDHGLHSLTLSEKRALKKATKLEQSRIRF